MQSGVPVIYSFRPTEIIYTVQAKLQPQRTLRPAALAVGDGDGRPADRAARPRVEAAVVLPLARPQRVRGHWKQGKLIPANSTPVHSIDP